MKYLNKFNESYNEVHELKDIALDLVDNGFYVSVTKELNYNIRVQITKRGCFNIGDVEYFLSHAISFMRSKGFNVEITSNLGLIVYIDGNFKYRNEQKSLEIIRILFKKIFKNV